MEVLRQVLPWFQILRPKNLIIIGLTQAALQYLVILPAFGMDTVLTVYLAPLFIMTTMMIAAGGYLINDIFDTETDIINKPESAFIPSKISLKAARMFYRFLVVAGFAVSVFIAIKVKGLHLLWIYPLATGLLFIYSKWLKATPLWGNVLVSLFTAFVWVILFVAQMSVKGTDSEFGTSGLKAVCLFYGLFAFLTNLIREIVKDLEDLEGDKAGGLKTTAASWGIDRTKNAAVLLTGATVACLTLWAGFSSLFQTFESRMYILVFVMAPLLGMMVRIRVAFKRRDYSAVSSMLKLIMLAGLVSIFFVTKNINPINTM